MKLPALITTDLHLTDKPSDSYRWDLFPWLREQCKIHKVKTVAILGDLTDAKDYHSSTLVNKIVIEIAKLSEEVEQVIILKGNHDYLKDGHSFFSFLSFLPKITFVDKWLSFGRHSLADCASLFLGHTKDPINEWKKWTFSEFDYVFMHQTVNGAVSENGQAMTSSLPSVFPDKPEKFIYSGDIHVPQRMGNVRYVGSPYPIRFGDSFEQRCILITKEHIQKVLHFETISKAKIEADSYEDALRQLKELKAYDQVKIAIQLASDQRSNWQKIRREILEYCYKEKIELHELTAQVSKNAIYRFKPSEVKRFDRKSSPTKTLENFVDREDLGGDFLDAGLDSIE